jgi:hypothetical protein
MFLLDCLLPRAPIIRASSDHGRLPFPGGTRTWNRYHDPVRLIAETAEAGFSSGRGTIQCLIFIPVFPKSAHPHFSSGLESDV